MSLIFPFDEKKYTQLRHELHQIPEIGLKEFLTKEKLLTFIKTFSNYNKVVLQEVLDTGFWFDITGLGDKVGNENYMFAFRTDLDALPLQEETKVDYKSKFDGMAHSCGHDGHMTILTATLEQVLQRLSEIPSNYTLRFLYQPAEESIGGAEKMIEVGCLKGVNEIYGIHNVTLFDVGEVGVKSGPVMAGISVFDINITGQGGHGSAPYLCKSPITTGTELVQKINQITSQKINSENRCVVSIGCFKSGEVGNVIPEKGNIKGTLRYFDDDTANKIKDEIQTCCSGIGATNKSNIKVDFTDPGVVTFNNKTLTDNVVLPALQNSNLKIVDHDLPVTASEDFSFYLRIIPGVFMMLGCKDSEHQEYLHTPTYNYNDKSTIYGVEVYLRIIEKKLNKSIFFK